ncbi:probable endonuclease 4 [Coraliomargarita sp. CAG:312]|nr:probable endonuclease 4 [Coraliomargarita sp. CAG:312]
MNGKNKVFYIGCHLSFAKGYESMGVQALEIGANAFQYFSRNPRGGAAKEFDKSDAGKLLDIAARNGFAPFLVHAPYTFNPCSADAGLRDFARKAMCEDLLRQQNLPGSYYNFHPGSHVGQGAEKGISMIAELLNEILLPEQSCVVLLETMSGKGSEVGASFGEIAEIMERVKLNRKLGVCLDTCHVYSAGYDIVRNLDGVLEEFDSKIGLERLKAVHLNDSMTPFNSRKDRHAKIGEGTIGLDAIARIINHPKLSSLPFYLETPNELSGYAREIALLRSLRNG